MLQAHELVHAEIAETNTKLQKEIADKKNVKNAWSVVCLDTAMPGQSQDQSKAVTRVTRSKTKGVFLETWKGVDMGVQKEKEGQKRKNKKEVT
jgi:hypothetical protein